MFKFGKLVKMGLKQPLNLVHVRVTTLLLLIGLLVLTSHFPFI